MSNDKSYIGRCFCGEVQFAVKGQPEAMGYCHCESCRHWSAGPVNAFTLWKPEALEVTQGVDKIGTYNKTPASYRKWCRSCGGHIFTEHPENGIDRCICGGDSRISFRSRCSCQLPRSSVAYQGWNNEDEGCASGNGRFRRNCGGIILKRFGRYSPTRTRPRKVAESESTNLSLT